MYLMLYVMLLLFFGIYLIRELSNTCYQITPLVLYLALFLVDVLFPAALSEVVGMPMYPYYYGVLGKEDIFSSVCLFSVASVFFILGYRLKVVRLTKKKPQKGYTINEKMLYFIYFLAVLFMVLNVYIEMKNIGGFDLYYTYKIKRVYLSSIHPNSFVEKLIATIASKCSAVLMLLNSCMFLNRLKFNKKFLWGKFFPILTFLLIFYDLHRGTVLNYFISLAVVEVYRNKNIGNELFSSIKKRIRKDFFKYAVGAVFFFLGFGTIRGSLNSSVWGYEMSYLDSFLSQIRSNFGVSLMALARVAKYSIDTGNVLMGRTIYEMFYFFVPRFIFVNKPVRYGIISASILMGSPPSTMDAITIPGEMILNFGFLGIAFSWIFGYVYKVFKVRTYNDYYLPIYATLITSVTVTFWMSFTGLFSQLIYIPIYIIILKFVYKKEASVPY